MFIDFKRYQNLIDIISIDTKLEFKIQSLQHYQSFYDNGSEGGYSTHYHYRTVLDNTLSNIIITITSNDNLSANWEVTISRRTRNSSKSFTDLELKEMKKYILENIIKEQYK